MTVDTIPARLQRNAVVMADRPAYLEKSSGAYRPVTWAGYAETVRRVGKALMALGLGPRHPAAILGFNRPEWVTTYLGAMSIGSAAAGIYTTASSEEAGHVIRHAGAPLVLVEGKPQLDKVLARRTELPDLRWVVTMRGAPPCDDPSVLTWDQFLERGDGVPDADFAERSARLAGGDPATLIYTSGTTGIPKGVVLTHHSVLNNGYIIGEGMRFTEKDRLCIPVPFYHCFGMVLSNLASVTHGSTMVLPGPTFDAEDGLKTIQNESCTAVHGVPTMFIAELTHPDFSKYNLKSLRTGIMAGSPCPIEVMREVNTRMHMSEIVIVYGQTETSPGVTMTTTKDPVERRVTTVGRAFPHTELKIIDPQTGKIVPHGEIGEICARGYCVMKCYYNNPSATHATLDSNHWNHTGDLGTMDEEGYFKIVGRLKDMVIRGGENIYPREIEEFLFTHPKVRNVQVIGVPDEKYGEEVQAWIELREGETATQDEIREFCKGKIAHYKIPRYVKFVTEYPMTVTGKIQKFKMREAAIKELGLEKAAQVKMA